MKCSFCGNLIDTGTGLMFVNRKGDIRYFCSSKCEKNWKLKRDPKKIRWTKIYRKLKGKE